MFNIFAGGIISRPFAFQMINLWSERCNKSHFYQLPYRSQILQSQFLCCLFFMCLYREGTRLNHLQTFGAMPIKVKLTFIEHAYHVVDLTDAFQFFKMTLMTVMTAFFVKNLSSYMLDSFTR